MSLHTKIARRLFPKEQTFMAKRKLHYATMAVLVGLIAAALLFGVMMLAQKTN